MNETIFLENSSREVLMFGSYVGVCWNVKKLSSVTLEGTRRVETTELVRYGKPYIDFLMLRQYGEEWVEDEDSPVDGGFSIAQAKTIIEELGLAISYLERPDNDKQYP